MATQDDKSHGTANGDASPIQSKWEAIAEAAKAQAAAGTGTQWLRLAEDGETATVAFCAEPHATEVVFEGGRYVRCDAGRKAELKAQGKTPTLRVAFNVVDVSTMEMKIFEAPVYFFQAVVSLRGNHPTDAWCFVIKRKGAARDPKTFYFVEAERPLTAAEQAEVAALPTFDLAKTQYAAAKPSQQASKGTTGAGGMGSAIQSITDGLQGLPFEATGAFCTALGIRKLTDLTAADVTRAKQLLDKLTLEHADIVV